jgi:hypothetical protein
VIDLKTGLTQIHTSAFLRKRLPLTHAVVAVIVAIGLGHVVKASVYLQLIAKAMTKVGYDYHVIIVCVYLQGSEIALIKLVYLNVLLGIIGIDESRFYDLVSLIGYYIYLLYKVAEVIGNGFGSTLLLGTSPVRMGIPKHGTKRLHALPFVFYLDEFIDDGLANYTDFKVFNRLRKSIDLVF